jgi:glycosyltransferase involved in cell wall biosynthesis
MFIDPIYDKEKLGILRKHCFSYIHSYEVGGTNPSLLEQMMFEKPILVNDIPFNREVVEDGGIFFTDVSSLSKKIDLLESKKINEAKKISVFKKNINQRYNWEKVTEDYEKMFKSLDEK